jgi:hypothetical protein
MRIVMYEVAEVYAVVLGSCVVCCCQPCHILMYSDYTKTGGGIISHLDALGSYTRS